MNRTFLLVMSLLLASCNNPTPTPSPSPVPIPTPIEGHVYGFTVDSVDNVAGIVDSIKALPTKPWVRVVFDYPEQPSAYSQAITQLAKVAEIVGQPSDSTYSSKMSVDAFKKRFSDYVQAFPQINVWEICNECNGDWAGSNTPAQTDAAFDVVKAAGKKALFTPYWNAPDCEDKHGNYIAWTQKNISAKVKQGSDFVMVSIYGMDCSGPEPTYSELDSMVTTFSSMFPNASVGVGEYGAAKAADKERILRYYLSYQNSDPRYIFFGGYWYGLQDFVPRTNPLWAVFASYLN